MYGAVNMVSSLQAIGARNTLKSIAKERESHKHQLQTLITEKKVQLERCVRLTKNTHAHRM